MWGWIWGCSPRWRCPTSLGSVGVGFPPVTHRGTVGAGGHRVLLSTSDPPWLQDRGGSVSLHAPLAAPQTHVAPGNVGEQGFYSDLMSCTTERPLQPFLAPAFCFPGFAPVFFPCLQKKTSVLPKTPSVTFMLNIFCSPFCSSVELSSFPSPFLFICCILHFHKQKMVSLHF